MNGTPNISCPNTAGTNGIDLSGYIIALVAEWLRVRLRVRMVRGSTLTVGNFLSLENLNVIIRAIN